MKKFLIFVLISSIPCIGWSQQFDIGEIENVRYKIYIPENWNGGLVMYAHGYESIGEEGEIFDEVTDDFMQIFTSRGFAYAASNFRKQGLIIKDGIDDTEALRAYFSKKYGKPNLCFITGHSMGGIISLASVEKFPAFYDGALPLCGWLAPVHFLTKRALDMLVIYDYLFGRNNGEIIDVEKFVDQEKIQVRLDRKPRLVALFSSHFMIKTNQLAEVISFNQFVIKEISSWLGGLPSGNIKTIYSGFGDLDKHINKDIKRYKANNVAEEYYIQNYSPTGELFDPVLALHTIYDELLPVSNYEYYEQITKIKHSSHNYVQQYTTSVGHCAFSNDDIETSFEDLLIWVKEGKRPNKMNR